MVDLLLLSIPIYEFRPYIVGASSLHTYLNNNGVNCVLRDPISDYHEKISRAYNNDLFEELIALYNKGGEPSELCKGFIEHLYAEIDLHQPKVVGLSCIINNRDAVLSITKFIKEKYPHVMTIVGGPNSKYMKEQFSHYKSVDFLFTGEAESGFVTFFDLDKRHTLLGLSYRNEVGMVVHNGTAPAADLTNLPIAYHDKAFKTKFHKENYETYYPVVFSRGCPYHCSFCDGWKVLDGFRYFPIERVVDFIKSYKDDDRYMLVEDSILNGNDKWLKSFARAIIDNQLKVTWGGMFRFHPIMEQEGYWDLLGQSGLVRLNFGLESGSPSILKNLGKFANMTKMFNIFNRLREAKKKYPIRVSVMIMIGTPYEEEVDFQRTMRFLYFNRDVIDMIDSCAAFVLEDDLIIYNNLKKEGILNKKTSINWATPYSSPEIRIDRMRRITKFLQQINLPARIYDHGIYKLPKEDWAVWEGPSAEEIKAQKAKQLEQQVLVEPIACNE